MTELTDVQKVVAAARHDLGEESRWASWPGGWLGDIEAALVDAVFSARAVYETKRGRGVKALVTEWRSKRTRGEFSLEALRDDIDSAGIERWATDFGSKQHSPSRSASADGGPTKAAAVREAAQRLIDVGISTHRDVDTTNAASVRAALGRVDGIGYATTNYFLMLLGAPGVKPDRMIHRFLDTVLGREKSITNAEADKLVTAAAADLGVQPHVLDHAIWAYESEKASDAKSGPANRV